MDIKRYFTFKGRLNRVKHFFITVLLYIPVLIICQPTQDVLLAFLVFMLSIVYFILSTCAIVQRLHDIERPGTHIFLLLIPIYHIYLVILLFFKKGTDGPNKYGDDPLIVAYE